MSPLDEQNSPLAEFSSSTAKRASIFRNFPLVQLWTSKGINTFKKKLLALPPVVSVNAVRAGFLFKLSFFLCVFIPTLLIVFYFAFMAADQFAVETRFAIRMARFDFGQESANRVKPGATLAGASPVGAPALASQEAYIVAAYIRSAAIFEDLSQKVDLQNIFTRPEGDFWARLKPVATREDLLQYWRNMVEVNVNNMSGVVTVIVKSFRPEDSYRVARAIVEASETLVNRLSMRARGDAVDRAEQEVRRNEKLVRKALEDLRMYRDSERFIDPGTEATSTTTLLLQAMGERIRLQNEYFVASRAMSPNAPSVATLKSGLEAIDQQIEQLKSRMAGGGNRQTISAAIGRFEELELQRQFAEKLYGMSQDALERARQKAEWQNIYLSLFIPPELPQLALFPERLNMSLLYSLVVVILWGIFALVVATIRDHVV
ncbi:MAG TPA: capsule biosynthesis protein [Beijerinckiaceae bacterium]|nr:capsule biosynthesis protein [Beijerinckiaceae bacterium]